jgi:hypothetical protein
MNRGDFELDRLTLCRRLDQRAGCRNAAASRDMSQNFLRDDSDFDDELHALESRAVIQLDERNPFGVTPRRIQPRNVISLAVVS